MTDPGSRRAESPREAPRAARPGRVPLHTSTWLTAAAATGLLLLAAPRARAQIVVHTFVGGAQGDTLGWDVDGAGDVDGDGFSDVILGIPGADPNGVGSGNVEVYSGRDGSRLYVFAGDDPTDALGSSVRGAGDVDGDGFADLVAGIPLDDDAGTDAGRARVYSGIDGQVIYTFDGDTFLDAFGSSVSGAGDVNGDGFDDLIVGAPCEDDAGQDAGSARVFSGADGSLLRLLLGEAAFDAFGTTVSGAGDLDQDGFDDLLVGSPLNDAGGGNAGALQAFSGRDGTVIHDLRGSSSPGQFGFSVRSAGLVDGDGIPDFIVGAIFDLINGPGSGSATVFSGADASVLYVFAGDDLTDNLGRSVGGAGDVDGDGVADLVVGIPRDDDQGTQSGTARVFSGADGALLFEVQGAAGDQMGYAVAGAGDADGDGFGDVVVAEPFDDGLAGIDTGVATVLTFCNYDLTVNGGTIGTFLSFLHSSPCTPGFTAVTFVSLTGGATPLLLPGGVTVLIDADTLTLLYLANPAVSITALDTLGLGATGVVLIPNNPLLQGTPVWAAGALLPPGSVAFSLASPTVTFTM